MDDDSKRHRGMSIFGRLGARIVPARASDAQQGPVRPEKTSRPMTESELEHAYRELLLENQMLAESNKHLHDRLARQDRGFEESPAAKELIGAQRNALVERSRRLRELEYENKQLQRDQKKLSDEKQRLNTLVRQLKQSQPSESARQLELLRQQLTEAQAALREKNNELLKLTDKYYQLEARSNLKSA